jgi:hypothetical protein
MGGLASRNPIPKFVDGHPQHSTPNIGAANNDSHRRGRGFVHLIQKEQPSTSQCRVTNKPSRLMMHVPAGFAFHKAIDAHPHVHVGLRLKQHPLAITRRRGLLRKARLCVWRGWTRGSGHASTIARGKQVRQSQ